MEAQGAAARAINTVPVTTGEVITHVNTRLERLENAVAQSATAEPEVQALYPDFMEVRSKKVTSGHPTRSKKSRKSAWKEYLDCQESENDSSSLDDSNSET